MTPSLSAVVTTDSYATIQRLVESLAAQDRPERIELIVVAPPDADLEPGPEGGALGGYRTVEVPTLTDIRRARTLGFAAASAPIVLLAETHCYPAEGWLEAVLAGHADGWVVVGPGFLNANPASALSWAAFLDHYGEFAGRTDAGETSKASGHNSTVLREPLLALGPELMPLLRDFPELHRRLGSVLFQPAARMSHINMSRWRSWAGEAWMGGRVGAACRARDWPRWRRIGYALATPLIIAVELARRAPAIRRIGLGSIPLSALPLLVAGVAIRCTGEGWSFLLGSDQAAEAYLAGTEIRRLDHVNRSDQELWAPTADTASRRSATTAAAGSQE